MIIDSLKYNDFVDVFLNQLIENIPKHYSTKQKEHLAGVAKWSCGEVSKLLTNDLENEFLQDDAIFITSIVAKTTFYKAIDVINLDLPLELQETMINHITDFACLTAIEKVLQTKSECDLFEIISDSIFQEYLDTFCYFFENNLIDKTLQNKAFRQSSRYAFSAEEHYEKAKTFMDNGDLQSAEIEINNAILLNIQNESYIDLKKKIKKLSDTQFIKTLFSLLKMHLSYLISNILLVVIGMYLSISIYCRLNDLTLNIGNTVFQILIKPSFFIPVIFILWIKNYVKYIFVATFDSKGTSDSIKSRFCWVLNLLKLPFLFIFYFIKNCFKKDEKS